jgi:hypothetical protein
MRHIDSQNVKYKEMSNAKYSHMCCMLVLDTFFLCNRSQKTWFFEVSILNVLCVYTHKLYIFNIQELNQSQLSLPPYSIFWFECAISLAHKVTFTNITRMFVIVIFTCIFCSNLQIYFVHCVYSFFNQSVHLLYYKYTKRAARPFGAWYHVLEEMSSPFSGLK